MAGLNPTIERGPVRSAGSVALNLPRVVMSWEDWLTFAVAVITFVAIGHSLEQANWVDGMPPFIPTVLAGLAIGMLTARTRLHALAIHPVGLLAGAVVVVLVAQTYADGPTLADRLADFRVRMVEWFHVVRAGDISNDNLPFVTLVQGTTWLAAYLAAWCLFRWHNAWLALLPGGFILLTNISFLDGQPTGDFVVFLFGAIVLISRVHLQKHLARWRAEGVDYPEFISVSLIQLTVAVAAALVVLAWWLPLGNQAKAAESVFDTLARPFTSQSDQLVRLFHNIDSRRGANLHTFGNTLPIQGDVTLGSKRLFEVNSAQAGLLRATSYEVYTGNGWKAGDRDSARVDARELAVDARSATYEARTTAILRVKLLSSESTILTPGVPLAANLDTRVDTAPGQAGDIERMRSRVALGPDDTYNSFGSVSTATAAQLDAAGTAYPDWVAERYLQLPNSLPQSVRDETRRIIAESGARTPYQQAKAIEAYLRSFPYDLAVPAPPPGRDAVEFLLFDLKRGYFDYQSSAMCVMLRTAGIPCRVAVGYVLTPGSGDETLYTVRKSDAYSWVEVFFPSYGWVEFNPTSDRPEGGAGGLSQPLVPSDPFVEPSLEELFGPDYLDPTGGAGPVQEALAEDPVINQRFNWLLVIIPLSILALVAAAAVGLRVAWNWGLAGLDERARLWAHTQRLAGWAGLGPRAPETPREWSRRLGRTIQREEPAIRLSQAYEESRYARPDQHRVDDAEAAASYRSLRGALLGRLFGRKKPRP
ncbi:transglutaminase domain-containing protein [Tepidiforma sp.]|uniref:transglutaminase domain-containing protein n=1 Tax=Tepidiforma sp. TaxID=2682230 RepID=UPI00262C5471|nr:transglutaminase domain-containing protein [Tepidiforma sp.]MCX7617346.1 transglutaminase domain-containing protein [Tepidiforma sp.]